MERRSKFSVAVAILTAALMLTSTGCPKKDRNTNSQTNSNSNTRGPKGDVPSVGQGTLPQIDPPAPRKRLPTKTSRQALPDQARAHFPAFDGDSFTVTLPVRQQANVSTREVLDGIIAPILKAVGFERGTRALSMPPDSGIKQPVADFRGLAQQVADEYQKNPRLRRPKTQKMIDAFLGRTRPDAELNAALKMGEGMDFAQFVAGIERLAINYPFQQVEGDVPIEHTNLTATRWEGQSVTSVYGVLFNNYAVANRRRLDLQAIVPVAVRALNAVRGVSKARFTARYDDRNPTRPPVRVDEGPFLVLLPYGTDAPGVTQMRYAYRMILTGTLFGREAPFLLWADADNGRILKLESLLKDVSASGEAYNRDPGVGTTVNFFQVDSAVSSQYALKLTGVLNRVDFMGDGFNAQDVSISDSMNGSSATFANFNQAPINDEAQALCGSGTNKGFQQVNFFSTIHRYYQTILANGIFTPFPSSAWNPKVESASAGCNAWSDMDYGVCGGYTNAACPNVANEHMNFAHDNTVVGHELGHNITPRLTNARPANWCGMMVCSIPLGWGDFHDIADFWADHLESTNCTAGWVSKNMGGVNNSLNCTNHTEGGGLPRLHIVTAPFNPAAPGDHFPEHRNGNTGDYADGQVASALLWQVRVGMRSKCRPSGLPQFGVRYQRALKETGFLGGPLANNDRDRHRKLYDLEAKLVDQWATSGSPSGPPAFAHNGPHTTNKVTAGFARGGVFLIPYQCIDGDVATTDPAFCPGGENGGDAVIDIDDNDPADDFLINGVTHPEFDFLELGGPAPTFHVWTGPRYRFDAAGADTMTNPAPCNTKFMVEVSTDPAFAPASTVSSAWINVDVDPTTAATPEGYGTWTPSAAQWTTLQAGGAGTLIYYRVRTRDASDGNERISTSPGGGLWTVSAPYAVVTADGQSDY